MYLFLKSTYCEYILENISSTSEVGPILALIAPSPLLELGIRVITKLPNSDSNTTLIRELRSKIKRFHLWLRVYVLLSIVHLLHIRAFSFLNRVSVKYCMTELLVHVTWILLRPLSALSLDEAATSGRVI